MGFYGNISNSNKSAFTFDRVYGNRWTMDQNISNDQVFLGRYVLVEYDDTPINIWPYNDQWFMDEALTQLMTLNDWKINKVYRLVRSGNDYNEGFYYYLGGSPFTLMPINEDSQYPSPYAYNYRIDINAYGRGYDGTVWRKMYEPESGKYRYVMLAELNAAVPSFHLVVKAPNDITTTAPSIDTSDSTNLNYYVNVPTHFYERFAEQTNVGNHTFNIGAYKVGSADIAAHTVENFETITQYVPKWQGTPQTHQLQQLTQKVNITYNKLGFEPNYHQASLTNNNVIGYSVGSSGRLYDITPGNAGHTSQDTKLWKINLPGLGNAAHIMYDTIFGYKNSGAASRETQNWLKTSLSDDKVYDMKTLVGAINHIQDILGYNFSYVSTAPTASTKSTVDNTLYFVGTADQSNTTQSQRSAISAIYYYRKVPQYTQSNTGEYYKTSDGVYRVANKDTTIITPAERYTVNYYYKLTELKTPVHQGIIGLLIDLQRRLGISEDSESNYNIDNSRDPTTIQGMINRAGDMLSYLSTSVAANKLLFTDQDGVFRTMDGVGTITTADGVTNSPVPDVKFPLTLTPANSQVFAANGSWVYRLATLSVTNSTADTSAATISPANGAVTVTGSSDATYSNRINFLSANKWIKFTSNNGATAKSITFEHLLNGITYATSLAAASLGDSTDSSGNPVLAASTTQLDIGPWVQSSNSVWLIGETGTDKLADSQLNIPSYKFDAAGHMIGYTNHAFYVPHGFKTIRNIIETNSSSNVNGISETATTIVADNAIDTLTFTTANKWIDIIGDANNDKFTFAHHLNGLAANYAEDIPTSRLSYDISNNVLELGPWIQETSDWLTGTPTTNDTEKLLSSQINIPSYKFDGAGHMVGWETKSFYMPHSFKEVYTSASNSNSAELVTATGEIVADEATDKLTFSTANKWIDLVCDVQNDSITFGHHLNGQAAIYKTEGAEKPWLSYNSENNAIEIGPWVQNTSDWTKDAIDAVNNLSASQINIPSYTFDAAGHMIGYTNYPFYLPHSWKSISITNSTAVGASAASNGTVVAKKATDLLAIAAQNKWLEIDTDNDNNTITIGHVLTSNNVIANTRYGLLSNQSVNDIDTSNNQFTVPEFTVDEAGHVIAAVTHTVTLPDSFNQIAIGAGTNEETTSPTISNATINIEADTMVDTFTLTPGNKWIVYAPNASNDSLAIYHKTLTASTIVSAIDLNTVGTFNTQQVAWDGAGHITSATTVTYTLPYNWKTITTLNSNTASSITPSASTINASTQVDTVQFSAGNKWLLLTAEDHTVTFGHKLSDAGAHTTPVGSTIAPATQFSTAENVVSFVVPNLTIDEAGHVTSLNSYTVTYPTPTFSSIQHSNNDTAQIITSINYTPSNAGLSIEYKNLGTFLLTGYTTPEGATDTLLASDTLNEALGKLVSRISTDETNNTSAHNALDERITNVNTAINETITNANTAFNDRITNLETSVDTATTGLLDRTSALEQTINTAETGLSARVSSLTSTLSDDEDRIAALEEMQDDYQPLENSSDPYAVRSYVDNAIAKIFENFSLTLNPLESNIVYENNLITPSISAFDGSAILKLQNTEDNETWVTVEDSEQMISDGQQEFVLDSYTITKNGSYRLAVRRSYQGKQSEWAYSASVIVDDIIEPTPEENPEQP